MIEFSKRHNFTGKPTGADDTFDFFKVPFLDIDFYFHCRQHTVHQKIFRQADTEKYLFDLQNKLWNNKI